MYPHLLRWRNGEKAGPRRVHLVLTERCNLHCLSCFMGQTPAQNREKEVPDELLLRLVEDAIRLGAEEVYLVGGEVFVRRELTLALMEKVKKAGLRGDLTTNATLIDEDGARRIVEMGWDRLQVSIDGPTPALNDAIRPPAGSLLRTLRGVERIQAWKERLGVTLPVLSMSTVLSNRNFQHLPALVDLAARIGVRDLAIQSLKDQMSEEAPGMMLGEKEKEELPIHIHEAITRAEAHRLATNLGNFLENSIVSHIGKLNRVMEDDVHDVEDPFFRSHCFVPWYYLVLHYDGRVSPCWEWAGEELGNARHQSLEEIWYGEGFERFRREFQAKKVPEHCAQCCLGYLDHTRWLREMGLLHAGNHREALNVAEKLLARRPFHAASVEVKARALYLLGRHQEGGEWIMESAKGFPGDGMAEIAYLLDVPRDFDDRKTLNATVEVFLNRLSSSEQVKCARHLLPALASSSRHQEVLSLAQAFEEAHSENPSVRAEGAVLDALYGLNRPQEARARLLEGVGNPNLDTPSARAELLFIAHRHRDSDGVLIAAEKLLASHPQEPFARWMRAAALGKKGQHRAAREECLAALTSPVSHSSPFHDAVYDTLAELAWLAGNDEEAAQWCQKALEINPARPGTLRLQEGVERRLKRKEARRGRPGRGDTSSSRW